MADCLRGEITVRDTTRGIVQYFPRHGRARRGRRTVFRYRLIGTSIVRYCGRDVTGLTFEDAHEDEEHLAAHWHFYQQAVESKNI